ncbi:hypothetical protein JMJ56_16820 [Belnapia sp. T18]|uniref:Uncharacterized protein n=1 Tax=Belnapia arida TaxID=2804533 RepID=A0ABS1U4V8_9PROT|nr:hypothetical protein [Belnapia arida]MBL6079683.1 hypothetical protein [Belnapia arida]
MAVRDLVLPFIHANGKKHQYGCAGMVGPCHLTTWEHEALRFVHREPFDPFGMRAAPQNGAARPLVTHTNSLPFGLDVWRSGRMLNLAWDETSIVVFSFRLGVWEAEALALTGRDAD